MMSLFAIEKIQRLSKLGIPAEQIQLQMELFYPIELIRKYMIPMCFSVSYPNEYVQWAMRKAQSVMAMEMV